MTACSGTGRRWITGTVPTNIICPVCHRGYRSIGVAKPRRTTQRVHGSTYKLFGFVPEHEDGRAR